MLVTFWDSGLFYTCTQKENKYVLQITRQISEIILAYLATILPSVLSAL